MDKHDVVKKLLKLEKAFLRIKTITTSPEIDDICVDGVRTVVEVGDSLHPELVAELKRKEVMA